MADKTIAIKVKVEGTEAQLNQITKLEKGLNTLTKQRQRLNKQLKDGIISQDQWSKAVAKNNLNIKAFRNELNKARNSMLGIDGFTKKLGKSFTKLGTSISGAFIGLFAIQKLFQLVSDAIDIVTEFEQQMAKVKAITGATEEEFEELIKSAKTLGSVSRKTATQVGELQEELAKLGFTTDEILNSTAAIIELSEATGSDLAQSAKVAAGVLNAFGLEAKDTQELVDVMAKSFTSSALDLNKFEVAMSNIGPVTAEAGLSVEQTSAMLGILVDRNVQASKAGTGLRNVFLTLAKKGLTYEEAMNKINTATDRSAAATELFGKENAVVATILASTGDEVASLTKELNEAEGAGAEMAEVAGDTLAGDLDRVSSAWEGFILSVESGKGPIAEAIRDLLDFTATALQLLSSLGKTREELTQASFESKLPERVRQIREDEKKFQAENLQRIEESLKAANKSDKEILEGKVSLIESERELTNIQVERLQKALEEAGLSEEQRGAKERSLSIEQERLKIQDDLITSFKVEAGLQEDIEEIERRKRIAKAKALREEKEAEERRKKFEAAEKKRRKEREKEEDKLRKENEKNLKASLKNTRNLEQEALILSIEDKRDAEDKKLEIARQNALLEVKETENKNKEIAAVNAKFDAEQKALEGQRKLEDDEKKKEEDQAVLTSRIEVAKETANLLAEVTSARVERQKSLELAGLNAQLEQGLINQEQFEERREDIERKAFQRQKRIDIAQALANGAVAVTKTIAQLGGVGAITPAGFASLALVGAQTAAQVGIIAGQSFAEGGFTGDGFGSPDSTGFKPAGVVHEGEYVVPKRVLESQKGGRLVGALESMRMNKPTPLANIGFANGGLAGGTSSMDLTDLENRIATAVSQSMGSIQVINNATDTVTEAVRVNNIQSEATFG
jgi:hypothetical protein